MKYPHSRADSIEIFKKAVPQMSRHAAAFNPLSYAIWYEHTAGTNPALSQALAATETDPARSPLSDQDIENLYDTFIVENHGSFGPHYQEELFRTSGRNAAHFITAGRPLPQVLTNQPNADQLWAPCSE